LGFQDFSRVNLAEKLFQGVRDEFYKQKFHIIFTTNQGKLKGTDF